MFSFFVAGDMKLEESTNSEKQFLVFNDFDFLDLELEDTEVSDLHLAIKLTLTPIGLAIILSPLLL